MLQKVQNLYYIVNLSFIYWQKS